MIEEKSHQVKTNESNVQTIIENLKNNKYIDRKKSLKTMHVNGKLFTIVDEYQDKNRRFVLMIYEDCDSNFIKELYVLEGKKIHKANEDDYKKYNKCKMMKKYKIKKEDNI